MSAGPTSLSETAKDAGQAALLDDEARHLHHRLIAAMLETGSIPPVSELANRLETSEDAIHTGLIALAAADYLALDNSGQVSCLYPFSTTPTPHTVVINDQPRYAMCAIDALGIPAMLDQELDIEGRCAVCHAPIALRVRPSAIVAATPPEAMVVARRDEAEPAFAACCPFTVFVCGHKHAEQVMRRIAGTHPLMLAEALTHAEKIFADLLAAELPATRPRGRQWGVGSDA